ncbi:MAG: hypothetical protein SGJ03_14915 [Alphaproteobacteria bacterium]|nr:hypothetical protein [Alphaproteobacteria bacterium]
MRFRYLMMLMAACFVLQGCGATFVERSSRAPSTGGAAVARSMDDMDLKSFDKNDDDTLVRSELEEGLKRNFAAADANASGLLEPSEVRSFNDRFDDQANISPVIDWNADGKIVLAEFASQWRTLFERSDINRDGLVDADELAGRVREYKPRKLPPPTFSGKDGRPPGSQ